MKKYIPAIVVAVILLVVLGVVVSRKTVGVSPAKTPDAAAAKASADVQKKEKITALMQDAQKAYDTEDYPKSIEKTREILKTVDSASQEAKNLLQISQIRLMESAKQK
jgi:uncharacterized protein YxeA